jgi:hypothetical protein
MAIAETSSTYFQLRLVYQPTVLERYLIWSRQLSLILFPLSVYKDSTRVSSRCDDRANRTDETQRYHFRQNSESCSSEQTSSQSPSSHVASAASLVEL